MKKIFLIPMMAIMCTISAWGVQFVNINQAENSDRETALRAALAITSDSVVVTLGDNVTGSSVFVVESGARILLNLNGKELTQTFVDSDQSPHVSSIIWNRGNLRIVEEGNGILVSPTNAQEQGFCITNSGNLTIDGGVFVGQSADFNVGYMFRNAVITVEGGTPTTIINGGKFIMAKKTAGMCFSWQGIIAGSPIIRGGDFSDDDIASDAAHNLANFVDSDCSIETIAFSESYAPWVSSVYHVSKAGSASGKTYEADEELSADVNAEDILIKSGVTVTIPEGKTMIASSDLAFEDEDATLIIAKGGTLIVDDEIHSSDFTNIELTMDATDGDMGKYSNLLIKAGQIQEGHAKATVHFNTICNFDGATYKWQRFAVPTFLNSVKASDLTSQGTGYKTAIYKWNNASETWTKVGNDEILLPFHGYIMTINADAQADYDFQCELVGNGNPTISLELGWNLLANSYTAPFDVAAMLKASIGNAGYSAGVYVQKWQDAAGEADWDPYTYRDLWLGTKTLNPLAPMQAFIIRGLDASANITLDYEAYVYNPFMTAHSLAPVRHRSALEDVHFADVVVEAENGQRDVVALTVSADFSDAYDDGFDFEKFMNTECFNFYAVTELGNLAYVGNSNLDETALTLETNDQTSYTLKFENANLEGYAIRDNLTEDVISIAAESEYAFTAEANSKIEGRFVIVKQQATSIENTVATAKKGIYSMTGVYMGENFENIPAGMYIINGKKVVK